MSKFYSVNDAIIALMPFGTRQIASSKRKDWRNLPDWPPNLFAIAGYLLCESGAYSYIVPHAISSGGGGWWRRDLFVSEADVATYQGLGRQWMSSGVKPPVEVQRIWDQLWLKRRAPLCVGRVKRTDEPPAWWKDALGLFIIADEACEDVGYVWQSEGPGLEGLSWIASLALKIFREALNKYSSGGASLPPSLTVGINTDIVCVQPKSHTASIGCAFRSLSHNVALLGPKGRILTQWHMPSLPFSDTSVQRKNIVIIPYPFVMSPSDFEFELVESSPNPWGWFRIKQNWLKNIPDIADMIIQIVNESTEKYGQVHGIVLPEYAVTWNIHESIVNKLIKEKCGVEFLVTGSSTNCEGDEGNFVLTTQLFSSHSGQGKSRFSASRSKHHRWKITGEQLMAYGVADIIVTPALKAGNASWWEKVDIPVRELHVNVFDSASTFTTLICEDLARSDPCHQTMRDIGSSIVFALLMDGPQIPTRWSARYALSLADDPGSSVLTLTSQGLVELSNSYYQAAGKLTSKSIALWRDKVRTVSIDGGAGNYGVFLKLKGKRTTERSLDGRSNEEGFLWTLDDSPILVNV